MIVRVNRRTRTPREAAPDTGIAASRGSKIPKDPWIQIAFLSTYFVPRQTSEAFDVIVAPTEGAAGTIRLMDARNQHLVRLFGELSAADSKTSDGKPQIS